MLGIDAANKMYWKCNFSTWVVLGRDLDQRQQQKDWQVRNFEDSVFAAVVVAVVAVAVVEFAAFAAIVCIQAENL